MSVTIFHIHSCNKSHFLALRQSDKVVEEVCDERWSGSAMKISHSQVPQPTPRRHLKSGGEPVYIRVNGISLASASRQLDLGLE